VNFSRPLLSVVVILLALTATSTAGNAISNANETDPEGIDHLSSVSAQQAYRKVVAWGLGVSRDEVADYTAENSNQLDAIFAKIEKESFKYRIMPEFALAVVAAENRYNELFSWARYDSWKYLESVTGHQHDPPPAFDDLPTAFAELDSIMEDSDTIEDMLKSYWCGPGGKFNADSLEEFTRAASKIWKELKPFAEERKTAGS
jgi:hypothetical protein